MTSRPPLRPLLSRLEVGRLHGIIVEEAALAEDRHAPGVLVRVDDVDVPDLDEREGWG